MSVLARNTDPATSHLAGKRAARFANSHKALILDAIAAHPNVCAPEIAVLCGWRAEDNPRISRRMKELVNAGLVIECPVKEWGGRHFLTYRLPEKRVRLGEQEPLF